MRRMSAWLSFSLCAAGLLTAIADAAQTERLIFLSTQLRPIEEAQKMRNLILKDFPREVDYVTEQPQQFPVRIEAEQEGGAHTIDVVGALHGELQPLVQLDALVPLDDLAGKLTGRGIPDPLMTLGKFGTAHQLYIPWMQASYIMVANKKALPYLPDGADINALSYDQLAAWASTIQQKTGKRLLGFPAGPQGLDAPLLRGLSLPVLHRRRRGSVPLGGGRSDVDPVRVVMEERQSELDQLQFHAAAAALRRRLDRLRPRCPRARRAAPEAGRFRRLPRPAGPKGRGYMPVLVGLAVMKGAPDMSGAMALIDYLTEPETQIVTAAQRRLFPGGEGGVAAGPRAWPEAGRRVRSKRCSRRRMRCRRCRRSASASAAASSTRCSWTRSSSSCCAARRRARCSTAKQRR